MIHLGDMYLNLQKGICELFMFIREEHGLKVENAIHNHET